MCPQRQLTAIVSIGAYHMANLSFEDVKKPQSLISRDILVKEDLYAPRHHHKSKIEDGSQRYPIYSEQDR
jgi:D-lyxose ketol-isomerase